MIFLKEGIQFYATLLEEGIWMIRFHLNHLEDQLVISEMNLSIKVCMGMDRL